MRHNSQNTDCIHQYCKRESVMIFYLVRHDKKDDTVRNGRIYRFARYILLFVIKNRNLVDKAKCPLSITVKSQSPRTPPVPRAVNPAGRVRFGIRFCRR